MLWCQREWDCIISMHLLLGRWSGRESCPEDILADAQLKQRSYEQTSWGSRRPWSHLSRHKYISDNIVAVINHVIMTLYMCTSILIISFDQNKDVFYTKLRNPFVFVLIYTITQIG